MTRPAIHRASIHRASIDPGRRVLAAGIAATWRPRPLIDTTLVLSAALGSLAGLAVTALALDLIRRGVL